MKINTAKNIFLMLILLTGFIQASTITASLKVSLDADILEITQSLEAFNTEKAKLNKRVITVIKKTGLSFSNNEELNVIIAMQKEQMLNEVTKFSTEAITKRASLAERFKELLATAQADNDWELFKALKAFRDVSGYFVQGIDQVWRDNKKNALQAVEEFWNLTLEEKGKILNKLLSVDVNAMLLRVGEKFEVLKADDSNETQTYALLNAPVGMNIQAKTGWITWRPTGNQVGVFTPVVLVSQNNQEVKREALNLFVKYRKFVRNSLFVDFSSEKRAKEDGSAEYPFSSIRSACKVLGELRSIVVRGGNHKVIGSETTVANCYGDAKNSIVIKAWGNEQVSISFDGRSGIQILNSAYVTLEGFEVIGVNAKVTYEEAMADWWTDKAIFQGTGIAIRANSKHILVQKNIVHDTTAAGIKSVSASSVVIKENIVYNCAWWTIQGTSGIAITLALANPQDTDNTIAHNQIIGNLIFNNESRIYSRVWAKGKADLRIDEGEGVLIQETSVGLNVTGDYKGRYLIKNNVLVYNGKTIDMNYAGRVDIIRNSLYLNGTTTSNRQGYMSAGLRVNDSDDVTFKGNAVDADETHGLLISLEKNSKDALGEGDIVNNYGRGAYTPHKDNEELPEGFNRVYEDIFENPTEGKFNVIVGKKLGASAGIMKRHRLNLKRYDIRAVAKQQELV